MIKKTIPSDLSLFSGVFLINSIMLLILDGKMAKNRPSTKKIKPIAIINSLTISSYIYLFIFGLIDLPKNLKKSLSGDKTNDVSPPIKAFSYACIAL